MADPPLVLIIDDESSIRKVLTGVLERSGYRVAAAKDGAEARAALDQAPSLVITDLKLKGEDGLALLKEFRAKRPGLPVVLMTAFGTIPDAVAAMRAGALDFMTKPVDLGELKLVVRKALAAGARQEREWLEPEEAAAWPLIGQSPALREIQRLVQKAAPADATVLILGETGTGKELVAQALHSSSPRRDKPFIKVHCGAIPEDLLEAELFGHEKGAFTGAIRDKPGKFELADGGSLFLDEVGEMSPAMQVKLLRVLQSGEFDRVGGTLTLTTDVRVVAATHQDLSQAVDEKRFREDLYYRLNVVPIVIPPLRERREDIPELAAAFLKRLAAKNSRKTPALAPEALDALRRAPWRGNVRELENLLERLVVLLEGDVIGLKDLPEDFRR